MKIPFNVPGTVQRSATAAAYTLGMTVAATYLGVPVAGAFVVATIGGAILGSRRDS